MLSGNGLTRGRRRHPTFLGSVGILQSGSYQTPSLPLKSRAPGRGKAAVGLVLDKDEMHPPQEAMWLLDLNRLVLKLHCEGQFASIPSVISLDLDMVSRCSIEECDGVIWCIGPVMVLCTSTALQESV
jgi:hypothetical protein